MEIQIQENVALAPLTTLKVGGAARFFMEARTEEEIARTVLFAKKNNLRLFILGGGSNVLISDKGFDGLVLKISLKGISAVKNKSDVLITAQAGEDWDKFVEFCVKGNLQGIECLSGIPGAVGGTPVQNVGAYGQEVSETIVSVRVLDRNSGEIYEMKNAECGFAYRSSVFNTIQKEKFIVLAVSFSLKLNAEPEIVYKDLQQFFKEKKPDLKETRRAVLQIRSAKSMVINENDPNSKSAGSFFKNPVVPKKIFDEIRQTAKHNKIENTPFFFVDEETVKIPAAWLIENSGFYKGFKLGNAGLSTKHALAIINSGNACAEDILNLKAEIQKKVIEKFGIELQPEPILVGFEQPSD